ncbi:hypothetical protein MsAg5_12860 [Methanosarcinaceae archaeon Ag5]|uniref:Uncharacterized protein n=1 Tax=Methanolapillus africanus TaxID=3028297 RepID=A0AAE4SEA4_9EURY|nr:hypothetical protein [Methanosarcinaceae archaeon Ag5]
MDLTTESVFALSGTFSSIIRFVIILVLLYFTFQKAFKDGILEATTSERVVFLSPKQQRSILIIAILILILLAVSSFVFDFFAALTLVFYLLLYSVFFIILYFGIRKTVKEEWVKTN